MWHTVASILRSLRINAVVVAEMMDHSISILLTTYAHFFPTMQNQAAQLMDDILAPIQVDFIISSRLAS